MDIKAFYVTAALIALLCYKTISSIHASALRMSSY